MKEKTQLENNTTALTRILALAAILTGIHAPAAAQTYTSFDALPNGTFPSEIDSSGRIVGRAVQANQTGKVFVRDTDGSIILTGAPASDWVGFSGTDDIVGRYQDAAGVEHSFVGPIAGPFSTFDVPGAAGTYATHSNSAGQIAGFWADSASAYHGFLRNTDGSITRFDVPGFPQTLPWDINTSGQIAGEVIDSSHVPHAFIGPAGGPYTTFSFPAGTASATTHMNDSGQVAGYYADGNFNAHGYLRDTNGTFTMLNEPGQVTVGAINQGGFIVGVFGGKYHGRKDGFMRRPDGTSVTLEFPGANTINSTTKPLDINQPGVIMGNYQLTTLSNGDTTWHGFIVTGVH